MKWKYKKYKNKKTVVDGITFDSKKEADRYQELLPLQRAGVITDLELQKPFVLIPAQYETVETGEFYKIGKKKGQPKTKRVCLEQPVKYIADFCYKRNGVLIIEDTKGMRTHDYIIKRKLMLYIHGIKIKEV